MQITKYFIAEVKDNNDLEKAGRVKIDVPELFRGEIGDSDLPWAKQDRSYSSDIPEIGEFVWVYQHDEYNHRNWYYKNTVTLKSYNDHLKFNSQIKTLLSRSGINGEYPNVKYNILKNGMCWGATSGDSATTAEYFIVHPNGTYITMNGEGKVSIGNQSVSLIEILTEIQEVLKNIVTPASFTGNLGAPVVYNQVANDLPKATALETKINTLFNL